MRVELRDGQWAELRERITHGADKEIAKAYRKVREDPDISFDVRTLVVGHFLRDCDIKDPDGVPVTVDEVDRIPEDIFDVLWDAAVELYGKATVPNAPTPS